MKNETFKQLLEKVTNTVQHYRTDLDHDREAITNNPGMPFIHSAYDCGTHIQFLMPAGHKSYPQPGERMSYLFGTVNRQELLHQQSAYIEAIATPGKELHYYNGKTLHSISSKQAMQIFSHHAATIRATWKTQRSAAA